MLLLLMQIALGLLLLYGAGYLMWPQSRLARPMRFLVGVPVFMIYGTPPQLHPEGRSERLRLRAAIAYAWKVSR